MLAVLAIVVACSGSKPARPIRDDASLSDAASIDAALPVLADTSWTRSHDFDGDGQRDLVAVEYTGGAHCCYKLTVSPSRTKRDISIPFDIEGGYIGGLSLERPENFTVEVGGDGVSSFVMSIAAYGGRWEPIPLEWVRTYGARSHRIRVSLRTGELRVENLGWDCASAVEALTHRRFRVWEGWPAACGLEDLDATRSGDSEVMLGTAKRAALLERLSTMVTADARFIALDVYERDGHVVRIDIDETALGGEVKDLVDALGPPEARIPYKLWGFTHRDGQWLWPSRGLVVYVDRTSRTVRRAGVFTPTDLPTYKRELAAP